MQLSPQSQTLFQNLFVEKTKEHTNNIYQYKQSLAQKARQRFVKNQIDRPNTSMMSKLPSYLEWSQNQYENSRKISMNESQLTVISVRKAQSLMHTIELSPQIKTNSPISTIRKKAKQLTHLNQLQNLKQRIPFSEFQEQQQQIRQKQYIAKLQLKHSDNPSKLKLIIRESRINSNCVQNYLQHQKEIDSYFQDKLFQQQKQISDKINHFKFEMTKLNRPSIQNQKKIYQQDYTANLQQ